MNGDDWRAAFEYAGLYAYDFGTHISVGYTAGEIRVLQASDAYGGGTPLEIYRRNASGGFELKGVGREGLGQREAMAFLRRDEAAARRDYDAILVAARTDPWPCSGIVQLARVDSFELPHLTALLYPSPAAVFVSSWLGHHALDLGDEVRCGRKVDEALEAGGDVRFRSSLIPTTTDRRDRSATEVLASTDRPIQR